MYLNQVKFHFYALIYHENTAIVFNTFWNDQKKFKNIIMTAMRYVEKPTWFFLNIFINVYAIDFFTFIGLFEIEIQPQ